MKKILLVISLTFLAYSEGLAQEYKIKGKVVDGQHLVTIGGVSVGFDSTNATRTGLDGQFELVADEHQINDTLHIFAISYNRIMITNFPKDKEIDLGTIPIYVYEFRTPLVHFDCGTLDFACKKERKKFWKEYEKELTTYFDTINTMIGYFRLSLNGKHYSIDTQSHLIDLAKPVE